MNAWIAPSMMCVDLFTLSDTLRIFTEEKIEYLHIDVMDGSFVPNYALGNDFIRQIRGACPIPLDLHLMVDGIDGKLGCFEIREGDIVSVHAEASMHLQRTLCAIRSLGAHPFVALNPATPLSVLDYVIDDVDGVLLMTVNPGFAGQKLIPAVLRKISDLRALLDRAGRGNVRIEVDGNVSFEKAPLMREAGADLFVAGTSSVFAKSGGIADNVAKMRTLLK